MSKRKNYFCDCIRNKDKIYWGGSHSSKSKQNLKRKIVKVIKDLNDNVLHDNLWRGRFYVTCDSIQYTNYSDGSGTYGWVYLVIWLLDRFLRLCLTILILLCSMAIKYGKD